MANVLLHLTDKRVGRQVEWWDAQSSLFTSYDIPSFTSDYRDNYRLELISSVGYSVNHADPDAAKSARQVARRMLVNHLYDQQLAMSHDLLHALHAGENRQKIIDRVSDLIDTMTESGND